MVFLISSISCCFFSTSSLECFAFSISSSRSISNFSISPLIRSMLVRINSAFCLILASSNCILDNSADASLSIFACISRVFWNFSDASLISCSRRLEFSISSWIFFLSPLISAIWSSICFFWANRPENTSTLSSFCCFARSTFIFAVFWRMNSCCSSSFTASSSSPFSSMAVKISSLRLFIFSISCFTPSISVSISSTSRLLARRLEEFLKAPPVMEPPGLKYSPSNVTIWRL